MILELWYIYECPGELGKMVLDATPQGSGLGGCRRAPEIFTLMRTANDSGTGVPVDDT